MIRLLSLFILTLSFAMGTVFTAHAAEWNDGGFDMGIGVLGIQSANKFDVHGFKRGTTDYTEAMQKTLSAIQFRRQPATTHPVIGKFEFSEDGEFGLQMKDGFFPVHQVGITLIDGTDALVINKRQGSWVEVIVNHAPRATAWMQLNKTGPLNTWLWFTYLEGLVKTKKPVVFITPVHDDFLYQPTLQSLAPLKNVFQLENTVLYPEKLNNQYLLVKSGRPKDCDNQPLPGFQDDEPVRAWVRWIQNNGRPRIFHHSGKCT